MGISKCPECKKALEEGRPDNGQYPVFICKCGYYGWLINKELVERVVRFLRPEKETPPED